MKATQQTPFIKDFTFFKNKFALQQKAVKKQLIQFGAMVEQFKKKSEQDDLENSQVSNLMVQVNQKSEGIQMEIDEMQELFMEIEKLNNLSMIERAQQQRLKNALKDLQNEHSTLKKVLKHQLRDQSGRASMNYRMKNSNRLTQILQENGALDSSVQQAEEIIQMGHDQQRLLQSRKDRFEKTNKTLRKMQKQVQPSIKRLMRKISSARKRNALILAFVAALCLSFLFYSLFIAN